MPDSHVLELLAMMQAGDLMALDRLAREYSQTLLAVARRQCHLRADAEDAVQQALLVASTAMRGIRGEGSPIAWLSTLVARSCFRLNKQAERTDELTEAPCTCDDPRSIVEGQQLERALGDALMNLPRTDRLLVLLSTEGFTSVELGERFGLSSNAVRSRLKRARQQLRRAVEGGERAALHPRSTVSVTSLGR